MRIKKARIQKYKSIIDSGEINFDDQITAFIGKNEQGKTNMLKSLTTINNDYAYKQDDLTYNFNYAEMQYQDPIITLWFILNEKDKKHFKDINLNIQNLDFLKISKFFDNSYNIWFADSNSEVRVRYAVWTKDEKEKLLKDIKGFLKKNIKLIGKKNEENHLKFISSLKTPGGGFKNDTNSLPSLSATYHAISTLDRMNSLDRIKKDDVIKYIMNLEDNKKGFKNMSDIPPTIQSTFYAIMSLEYLQSINNINEDEYVNYILSFQNEDGGFFHKEKKERKEIESRMDYTYFAVKILKSLNGLQKEVTDKIIKFISKCENPGGGYGSRPNEASDIASTAYAIAAMNEIDDIESITLIDHSKQLKFIESLDFAELFPDSASDVFYKVMILNNIIIYEEKLSKTIWSNVLKKILSFENANGGFSDRGNLQQMKTTFYSLFAINIFEEHLEFEAYFNIKKYICKESYPNSDKILKCLNYYKSNYIIYGNIETALINFINEKSKKESIESKILDYMPNIVYSDDKMDLLNDSIKIYEYQNNKEKYKTISNLFLLSEISIDELSLKTGMNRRRLTDAISEKITNMLKGSWKQAIINFYAWIDGDEIHFSIEDESRIKVQPTKRSDGFQWFLSFCINFKARTKEDLGNSILLLDNPGLQLHPSGQKDLLSTLEELSSQNQIIYTTHSPYLINIEHLEKLRIVERDKDSGTIIKEKYYHSSLDSLKPIRDSLGLTLRDSLFISNETLLVEGPSDKDILDGMLMFLKKEKLIKYNLNNLLINSAGGANKIPYLSFFMLNESLKFAAILDNDENGTSAFNELKNLAKIDEKQIIKLDRVKEMENISIEDLIDPRFYNFAVNESYEDILTNKNHGKIKIEDIDYDGDRLAKKYSKYFNDNGLGSFEKTLVARQIKKELEIGCEQSTVGMDTIENFLKIFELLNDVFNFDKM